MARYVLEAPDDLMAQAKTAAAREGVSFAEWLRQAALSRLGKDSLPRIEAEIRKDLDLSPAFAPVTAEKPVLCELRNPTIPSQKCRLELGHSEDHAFS